MSEADVKRGLEIALRYLSYQSRHSIEVKNRLVEKGIGEAVTIDILKKLEKMGYLDDRDWLERFIRTQAKKKRGKGEIFQKMYLKGIPKDQAQEAMEIYYPQEHEIENIRLLIKKNSHREPQKVINSLIRKGFSYPLIQEAMQEMSHSENEI
jgi:regulatory protein